MCAVLWLKAAAHVSSALVEGCDWDVCVYYSGKNVTGFYVSSSLVKDWY